MADSERQQQAPEWAMKAANALDEEQMISPEWLATKNWCEMAAEVIASHAPLDECVKAFGDIFNYAHKPEFVRKTAEDMITKLRGAQ